METSFATRVNEFWVFGVVKYGERRLSFSHVDLPDNCLCQITQEAQEGRWGEVIVETATPDVSTVEELLVKSWLSSAVNQITQQIDLFFESPDTWKTSGNWNAHWGLVLHEWRNLGAACSGELNLPSPLKNIVS